MSITSTRQTFAMGACRTGSTNSVWKLCCFAVISSNPMCLAACAVAKSVQFRMFGQGWDFFFFLNSKTAFQQSLPTECSSAMVIVAVIWALAHVAAIFTPDL